MKKVFFGFLFIFFNINLNAKQTLPQKLLANYVEGQLKTLEDFSKTVKNPKTLKQNIDKYFFYLNSNDKKFLYNRIVAYGFKDFEKRSPKIKIYL